MSQMGVLTEQEPKPVSDLLKQYPCGQEIVFTKPDPRRPWATLELNAEETADAMEVARRDKYYANEEKIKREEYQRRRDVFFGPWTAEQMYDYVITRANRDVRCGFSINGGVDGRPVFKLDKDNIDLIQALCYYFTNDPRFEALHRKGPNGEPIPLGFKLKNGILLSGPKGTGKTSIMRLFNRNKRCSYELFSCKGITAAFTAYGEAGGYNGIRLYEGKLQVVRSEEYFYNEHLGICFEDLGTEEEGVHFGNRLNVMRYLIETRYDNKIPYNMTHITTNLSKPDMERLYGERAWDRMKQAYNMIHVDGESRRGE